MRKVQADPVFSIRSFRVSGSAGRLLALAGPLIDRVTGLRRLEKIYRESNLEGLHKKEFVSKVLDALHVTYSVSNAVVPDHGPLIVVCNHPFGGLEGIILADYFSRIRDDIKFMSNSGLRFVKEMEDFFIFTNPLITHNHKNIPSIRACESHLRSGGMLILFPAGKTSYYRKDKKRITDGEWNRIAAKLAQKTDAPVIPFFFPGHNSTLFITLGRIYYRFRLLMLPRELVKKKKQTIHVYAGNILHRDQYDKTSSRETTAFLRMETYLQDPAYIYKRSLPENTALPPIAAAAPFHLIEEEISKLPEKQHLHDVHNFSVYYGYYSQLKHTVYEITRLRERTFRKMDEGSAMERDTDRFDELYTHLFIVDNKERKIIGAYRMGQIDKLLSAGKIDDIYLTKMFVFHEAFLRSIRHGIEMGRSFLIPEYQKSVYGFFLLWRGIGEFLVRNPQYRTLYGTVSLSTTYDPRSIALIHSTLVKTDKVEPIPPLTIDVNPDVLEYLQEREVHFRELDLLIRTIEGDKKGLPVLVRQYHKLGAEFLSIGRDTAFRNTPGMLLRVDMDSVPDSLLKMYMGKGLAEYKIFTRNH